MFFLCFLSALEAEGFVAFAVVEVACKLTAMAAIKRQESFLGGFDLTIVRSMPRGSMRFIFMAGTSRSRPGRE